MTLTALRDDWKTTVAAGADRSSVFMARDGVRRVVYAALVAGFACAYAVVSVQRHHRIQSNAYDLGIFEQIVRSYAEARTPIAELKGPGYNALGDHFHPILMLLAPVYRLHPHAETLLVAQAVLFAISVLPVARLATARLGALPGLCVGLAYGLSWGLQAAVNFDFHEIAVAVPLLAFSLEALVRQRWRAAVAWALPLLLVKEDLFVTVALIGLFIAVHRRRLGLTVTAGAVAAGIATITVLIPAFNPNGVYDYTSSAALDGTDPLTRWLTPATKWHTVLLLLAVTGFVACRSPLLLLMAPTLAWRFWETDPNYWGTTFHYSATLMLIAFIAFTDGLDRILRNPKRRRLPALGITTAMRTRPRLSRATAAAGVLAIALSATVFAGLPLSRSMPWQAPSAPYATTVTDTLDLIPDGATVAAANELAPQLTNRCQVSLWPPVAAFDPPPEWVATITDRHTWRDSLPGPVGNPIDQQRTLHNNGYHLVTATAGIAIYRR